jgi:hypothetical protein
MLMEAIEQAGYRPRGESELARWFGGHACSWSGKRRSQ